MNVSDYCIICLEEGNLIEYNHCGVYTIHEKCLNKWKSNDCLICRKNINLDSDENESNDSSESNDIQIRSTYTVYRLGNICLCMGLILLFILLIYNCRSIIRVRKNKNNYEYYLSFE